MKLTQFCIQRPVFSTVLSLVLIVLGITAFMQLHLRYAPEVFHPALMVQARYPGASAQVVEVSMADRLEKVLAATPDLTMIRSRSSEGQLRIFLQLKNMSRAQFVIAQSQVLQEIGHIQLPQQVQTPQVFAKTDSAQIMLIGVSDPHMKQQELANYVSNYIVPKLQRIPGVSDVQTIADDSALRVHLNPLAMAALGVTADAVINALETNNVSLPVGQLVSQTQNLAINADLQLSDVKQFLQIPILRKAGRIIRLANIATVSMGSETIGGWFGRTHHNQVGVGINIDAAEGANPIALGQKVRHTLDLLKPELPHGMQVGVFFDITHYLLQAIHEVLWTVLEAILLVVLITFLFLGNLRATLIPIITIPVCLVAAFVMVYALGFSINVMTLLALVLAVGLVVDDAIVVLENHHRHLELGHAPLKAAQRSSQEISFAVVAMTISLVAVYIPTLFLPKNTQGVYFFQFAMTLASAVLISGFVALTLSPMMCGRLLSLKRNRYENLLDRLFSKIRHHYQRFLAWVLHKRWWVLLLFIGALGGGVCVYQGIPHALLPVSNINIAVAPVMAPDSASVKYTEQLNNQLLKQVAKAPEIDSLFTFGGGDGDASNWAINFFKLKPGSTGHKTPQAFVDHLNHLMQAIPGMRGGASLVNLNSHHNGGFEQGNLSFYVAGIAPYPQMIAMAQKLTLALQHYPGVYAVMNTLKADIQQFNLQVRRAVALKLQVPLSEITHALQTFLGGYVLQSQYQLGGVSYPIVLQLPKRDLADFQVLQKLYVQSNNGAMVPLSRLVTVQPTFGVSTRMHIEQMRAGEIDLNISPGYTLGQVMTQINHLAAQLLPSNMQVHYGGDALRLIRSDVTMRLTLLLGVIFIYLILAALFESFLDPLIVLFTVPLCVIGALLCLRAVGGYINLYTGIALLMLIGLISKHGVLICRFANELQAAGRSAQTALLEAAAIRLRPILMTTATMVLGALPLVFAAGPGATGRMQIGVVIVSGLLIGTVFSLLVVPVAYSFCKRITKL